MCVKEPSQSQLISPVKKKKKQQQLKRNVICLAAAETVFFFTFVFLGTFRAGYVKSTELKLCSRNLGRWLSSAQLSSALLSALSRSARLRGCRGSVMKSVVQVTSRLRLSRQP